MKQSRPRPSDFKPASIVIPPNGSLPFILDPTHLLLFQADELKGYSFRFKTFDIENHSFSGLIVVKETLRGFKRDEKTNDAVYDVFAQRTECIEVIGTITKHELEQLEISYAEVTGICVKEGKEFKEKNETKTKQLLVAQN